MAAPFHDRMGRARAEMLRAGSGALLLGPSADLRYLTGYDAPPLERMTLLVLPADGEPVLVVPALERPRAEASPAGSVAAIRAWGETDDPLALVREAAAGVAGTMWVSDRLWATFVLRLQSALPGARFDVSSAVLRPLRARKDAAEIEALRRAGEAADSVALALQDEKVSGRTEREVSRWITERLLDAGCERVPFAIVASGPNAASPHHEPGSRVIEPGDSLVCDFGGVLDGYCSDISRTFGVGATPAAFTEIHDVVRRAQDEAVRAVRPGEPAERIDAVARAIIAEAGYGDLFVHRTGHGIGLEEHEDPYIVSGNAEPLEPGMAFSVEPGIYVEGSLGVRIEDIVVCGDEGPERLNNAPRELLTLA